jgi:nucleotide-binding universal stress UspA family protein
MWYSDNVGSACAGAWQAAHCADNVGGNERTKGDKAMRKILVAIDFSDVTPRVMEETKGMARAFGASVRLLHVAPHETEFVAYSPGGLPPPGMGMSGTAVVRDLRIETERIAMLMEEFKREGITATAAVLEGPVVPTILDEAKESAADLVVMGSHGHGALYELLVGSITEGVLRRSPMPVLVVPSRTE